MPFTTPHAPFQGPTDREPKPLLGTSLRWNQGRAPHDVYVAMNEHMDQSVGRILQALEDRGIAGNDDFERLKTLYREWEKTTRRNRRGRPE